MTLTGLLVIILLAGGCASTPPSISRADQNSGYRQVEAALQEAKAETNALRADLASARIAAAKQEAELRELRRQVDGLQQAVEAKQAEVITLRNERDQREHTATIAQARIADPAALPARMTDIDALQAKLHEMESALAALTAELAQVKKALVSPSPQPSPRMGEGARGEDRR